MMLFDFEVFSMLRYILTNMRWSGGEGLETPWELMPKAVAQLPVSSDLLARLLIEIMEMEHEKAEYRTSPAGSALINWPG